MRRSLIPFIVAAWLVACGSTTEDPSDDATCTPVQGSDLYHACSCCGDTEVCETVQMVTTSYRCVEPVVPGPDEFSCGPSNVCTIGTICEVRFPVGDGTNQYSCAPPPAACVDDLTCACVTAETPDVSCSEEDGNVTTSQPAT